MLLTNFNIANVAYHYTKLLKVPISKTTIQTSIQNNPYYPSLYCLSSVFDKFNIDNESYKISSKNLDELECPFIAHLNNQPTGKDFVLVTVVSKSEVKYISNNYKEKSVSKEKFLKEWENIVFIAERNAESGETDFTVKYKKDVVQKHKTVGLITSTALIIISVVYAFLYSLPIGLRLASSILLFLKILGITVSILLLVYEIDKRNYFVKSICTAGKQTNCNAVLQSKAAKFLGMSWSEAGVFYFVSTFLLLLFPGIPYATKVSLLSFANILAAPYILFSVFYQWRIIKQWCPLCLTVQAILAFELIWSIMNFWVNSFISVHLVFIQLVPIVFCILSPIIIWYVIKSLLIKAIDEPYYKAAYKRLLYNPDAFNNLLQQQQLVPEGHENIGITIGNPDAANTIIKVCNPYCGPCAKAHSVLDDIIHSNKNIKLKLIFTATNNEKDDRGKAARHFLEINKKFQAKTEQALDDWYAADKKDYTEFAKKYPVNGELKQQEVEIDQMNEWCKKAGIDATPTYFINGKRLPESYKIDELKYIL